MKTLPRLVLGIFLFASFTLTAASQEALRLRPAPTIADISPRTTTTSASDEVITVTGSGFTKRSRVRAGDMRLATTFISRQELQATIPADLLAEPAVLKIRVSTPPPGGGTSNRKAFFVVSLGEVSPTPQPQVAKYSIVVPRTADVFIEFGAEGADKTLRTWTRPTPAGGGKVNILVAGMRAFTTYHMHAVVQFRKGVTHLDLDHVFTTGGLPPDRIPSITVSKSDSLSPTPGVQLLDLLAGTSVRPLVTDLDGNVIWYYESVGIPVPIEFLPNGNFLLIEDPDVGVEMLHEIDLAGNVLRELTPPQLNEMLVANGMEPVAETFHHDARMLPNGHVVVMTSYHKTFTDLVGFEGQEISVVGDGLVELDENWHPVWVWSAFDHLDVNRHPMGFPDPFFGYDWTHGNAVVYSPADGNLLVSLRHQHWVLKIDYQNGFGSGNILWRLGPEGDFRLLDGGPADWQYAQHFPFILDDQVGVFRLAVFDNGNNRVLDEAGTICGATSGIPCYSRAVIFELDEGMETARVVWEDKPSLFAPFIGSIQVFDNGNVLWDAGAVGGIRNVVIREVTQEPTPQTVWEFHITNQIAYRSLRLPSLYPGVQW